MNVQVVRDARARRSPKIHPHVEPRGFINLAQRRLRTFRLVHHLIRNLFRGGVKLTRMQVRDDHQMSTDVRVEIQDHKTMLPAMQDEVVLIVLRVIRNRAEHTTVFLRINT